MTGVKETQWIKTELKQAYNYNWAGVGGVYTIDSNFLACREKITVLKMSGTSEMKYICPQ